MSKPIRLELGRFDVRDVIFSDSTRYRDGTLHIDRAELQQHLSKDSPFKTIEIDIAKPGEETRIVHALDVVEPRTKVSGPGCVFPGILGPPTQVGEGRTHRLAGVAVVGAADPFLGEDHWFAREAIIDMSGPGADYTPFSRTFNIVLTFVPDTEASSRRTKDEKANYMVDARTRDAQASIDATRVLSLRTAEYLARAVRDLEPDRIDTYELSPVNQALPKIVYVHHNIGAALYGSARHPQDHAMLLHPNELMDGVLVIATRWVQAALRDCTYFHQNNSIVRDLYSRHGSELNFLGVIFCSGMGMALEDKERDSDSVVKIARMLGADGAVIAPLRPGHGGVTLMMVCEKCEKSGIKTAIGVSQLNTGREEPGLNYWVPEADAMVMPGDDEHLLQLPAMKKAIGGSRILNTDIEALGPIEVDLRKLYGATAPMGPSRLGGRLH